MRLEGSVPSLPPFSVASPQTSHGRSLGYHTPDLWVDVTRSLSLRARTAGVSRVQTLREGDVSRCQTRPRRLLPEHSVASPWGAQSTSFATTLPDPHPSAQDEAGGSLPLQCRPGWGGVWGSPVPPGTEAVQTRPVAGPLRACVCCAGARCPQCLPTSTCRSRVVGCGQPVTAFADTLTRPPVSSPWGHALWPPGALLAPRDFSCTLRLRGPRRGAFCAAVGTQLPLQGGCHTPSA